MYKGGKSNSQKRQRQYLCCTERDGKLSVTTPGDRDDESLSPRGRASRIRDLRTINHFFFRGQFKGFSGSSYVTQDRQRRATEALPPRPFATTER